MVIMTRVWEVDLEFINNNAFELKLKPTFENWREKSYGNRFLKVPAFAFV